MRFFLLLTVLLTIVPAQPLAAADPRGEYIILCGGPALDKWEKYRDSYHDKFWGNFVRSGRVRAAALRQEKGPDALVTMLVYRGSYVSRAAQDNKPILSYVESIRDTYHINLVWFDTQAELLNYLNSGQDRSQWPILLLEYFGHSNRACFMFDYSNHISMASKCWLHEDELTRLRRGIFSRRAYVKSWGCHTGESFSQSFKKATGVPMWGAIGKTDFSQTYLSTQPLPSLSSPGGKWVQ